MTKIIGNTNIGRTSKKQRQQIMKEREEELAALESENQAGDQDIPPVHETSNNSGTSDIDDIQLEEPKHPFSSATEKREYSQANVTSSVVPELPIPIIAPETYEQALKKDEAIQATQPGPINNINPVMNQLDDKDKKIAAEAAADIFIDLYQDLRQIPAAIVKIDNDRLAKMAIEDEIDPDAVIQLDPKGNPITVSKFFSSFNEQVDDALKLDEVAFRNKVRDPLIRICIKRDIGASDEQLLGSIVVKDLMICGFVGVRLYKAMNNSLAMFSKFHKEGRVNSVAPEQSQAAERPNGQHTPPNAPQKPAPQQEQEVEFIDMSEVTTDSLLRELEYRRQMDQSRNKTVVKADEGVEKHNITFEDNPLRETFKPENFPAPKVEESFTPGQELTDPPAE